MAAWSCTTGRRKCGHNSDVCGRDLLTLLLILALKNDCVCLRFFSCADVDDSKPIKKKQKGWTLWPEIKTVTTHEEEVWIV